MTHERKDMKTHMILNAYNVEYNNGEYIRFGKDGWYKWYGDSLEFVYNSDELEEVFIKTVTDNILEDYYESV